jgi:TonB family protein
MPTPTPSFSFGGAVESGAESGRGGSKKVLLGVVALVVLAAAGYGAWMHWGRSGADEAVPAHVAESATSSAAAPNTAPAAVPQGKPRAAPASAPSQSTSGSFAASQPTSAADAQVSGGKTSAHSSKDGSETTLEKPSASTVASNKIPSAIEAEQPIVIKNGVSKPAKAAANSDTLAPSITNIPVTGSAALPALMGVNKTATPVLQRLSISQGVSRGLLIKQVQPSYPANALRMHIEGSVQLMTTLSKNGDITAIKVMSGDKQLAQAAVSAVKQWKYKPYLLNGEPVEIQTEVTVNFKLPR